MSKRRLAYIKNGLFSYTNVSVRQQLAAQFPELEMDVIDIYDDLIKPHRVAYGIGAAQAALLYRRKFAPSWRSPLLVALRTPFLFRKVRELIHKRLAPRRDEYAFTFQTQSLFDASVEGIPNFVFTDHTHLANKRYPAFRPEDLFPEPWTSLEREIYAHARHVFVMSNHVRDSLCEDYQLPASRVTTVFGGSNVDPSPAPLQNDGYANRTVVFVGVDWERKGGPTLARAFERLRMDVPDAKLIVVGCRPNLGQPWCEELGKISREDVKRHVVRGSVLCLPTRVEPFGIAVIEAFYQKLPVVVSDVGAMPTLVRHGESGLVVPSDDADALAAALRELLTDPARCQQFGEAGFRDVGERYAWPTVGRKLREGIEGALQS